MGGAFWLEYLTAGSGEVIHTEAPCSSPAPPVNEYQNHKWGWLVSE